MDYAQSLAYLTSLGRLGVQPGTERLAQVLQRLGQPQAAVPALHIAGTNGKGSTAAFAAHLLLAAAQHVAKENHKAVARIGLYTSPHLARVRERIQLSDPLSSAATLRECDEPAFARALSAVRAATEAAPPVELTFFEVLTAAAFLQFAEAGVAAAVIETGLGGRLDATRLCDARVTVVTGIGLDHTELLGTTLPAIAFEKAGIFRAGVPAVVDCDDAAALAVLGEEADRVGAPLVLPIAPGTPEAPWAAHAQRLPALPANLASILPLPGAHQRHNAALALAAVTRFPTALGDAAGLPAVQLAGLAATRWPGRLERLWPRADLSADALAPRMASAPPQPGAKPEGWPESWPEVWIDAAHNPQGAETLARFLHDMRADRQLTVLFGVVGDKAVAHMLAPLRHARCVVLTQPPSPRALPASELAALLSGSPPKSAPYVEEDWQSALRLALHHTPRHGLLVIYGSLFLIGAVRSLWLGEATDPIALQDPRPNPKSRAS